LVFLRSPTTFNIFSCGLGFGWDLRKCLSSGLLYEKASLIFSDSQQQKERKNMIPMPVNSKVVLYVNKYGLVVGNRNNLGNDLEIVVTRSPEEFDEAAKGVPYEGAIVADTRIS
jgi:hypothetical protein